MGFNSFQSQATSAYNTVENPYLNIIFVIQKNLRNYLIILIKKVDNTMGKYQLTCAYV